MDYQETLNFLYSRLPMFHRVGKAAYKANLDNALWLDELCNYPHRNYKTIHVAGTNGKGSVSHMIASILQKAGYKTGLFTSPHLKDFRERIRINGEMIPKEAVTQFVLKYKENFEAISPSFFEMTSALAFEFFNKEKVDVAVIEVGMGGRLDSTNIITPELSVITNIGFDHTEFLGDSLSKIAVEKAGIIKRGVHVVIGESLPETKPVFKQIACERNAPLFFADEIFESNYSLGLSKRHQYFELCKLNSSEKVILSIDLLGNYQQKNICTVMCAIELLKRQNFEIDNSQIETGLKNVAKVTGLQGRWQILSDNPFIICDTGHNAEGIAWVVKQIQGLKYEKLHFVFGLVNDKDIRHILKLLPVTGDYYFTKANIPRALDENILMQLSAEAGLRGKSFPNVKIAVDNAKKNAGSNDLIFIGGSTFIVAEAL